MTPPKKSPAAKKLTPKERLRAIKNFVELAWLLWMKPCCGDPACPWDDIPFGVSVSAAWGVWGDMITRRRA